MNLSRNIVVETLLIISELFYIVTVIALENEKCKTPNGEVAECKSIYKCPILLDAIKTEDNTALEFAKDSQCGFNKSPLVCCGNKSTYSTHLLAPRKYCGYQYADDYLSTTNPGPGKSTIDEFPWVAALYYKDGLVEKNLCVGTLINKRYVLTTAHCLAASTNAVISSVRLGVHKIQQTINCVRNVCSDPTTYFGVESYLVHEKYNAKFRTHNVGLIRLNRVVEYSDYIRPICLPLPGYPHANIGDTLYQSGWERSTYVNDPNRIKTKISSALISSDECAKTLILEDSRQFCTKYARNESELFCKGNSGAPLMFFNKYQWFQEGIVSFEEECGISIPEVFVHVNLINYIPWILKNIRS